MTGVAITFFGLPSNTLSWQALQNAGHGLVFFVLTVCAFVSLVPHVGCRIRSFVAMPALLFVLGVSVEVGQLLTGRGGSASDLVMNTGGIVAGVCIYMAYTSTINRAFRIFAGLAGVTILALCLRLPITLFIIDQLEAPLPMLVDFDHTGASMKIRLNHANATLLNFDTAWSENPSTSARLEFLPGRWPSAQFLEPEKDWSAYRQLTFLVNNPQENAVTVRIRVDDSSLGLGDNDHMTVTRNIPSGKSQIRIGFEEFREDAVRRKRPGSARFAEIQSFMVYLPNNEMQKVLYFDEFRLE